MEDRLLEDYKKAMKENNEIEKATIQYLRAMILKERKEKQRQLTDDEVEKVVLSERKKRSEALGLYEKANRPDMMEQTYKELACINRYLPKQYTEEELEQELVKIINELQANKSMFGQVMGTAKARLGNRADGKTMSIIVKRLLGA